MSPRTNAQVAFASAVAVLLFSAGAAYFTIARLRVSAGWVLHTFAVESALGELDASMASLARARTGFSITGNDQLLETFDSDVPLARQKLQRVIALTADNPRQREFCSRLEDVTNRRLDLFRQSIALRKSAPRDDAGQKNLTNEGLTLTLQHVSLVDEMRREEQRLLALRMSVSNRLYVTTVIILASTFALALLLFLVHYRLLTSELKARAQAERAALDGEDSLRSLTARLLQLQDEERRKFSRELHDSLGQYLASVKMNLEMYSRAHPEEEDEFLANALQHLDQSIAETRTISHLLHPPLLDEIGFASAAKWYLQGFSERSGLDVNVDLPEDLVRLPKPLELGLFRVLQETLTNIHRHAKSEKADVSLKVFSEQVILKIKDYGKGIPQELLVAFRNKGTSFGVGLTGMRERVRELGGHLEVQSDTTGTLVSVTLPIKTNQRPAASPVAALTSIPDPRSSQASETSGTTQPKK
jgi:signal transduction histidine kinase